MSIAAMRHRADAVNFSNKSRQEEGIVKLSLPMDVLVTSRHKGCQQVALLPRAFDMKFG